MRSFPTALRRFARSPLALAAALAMTAPLPAQAQFFSYSGSVFSTPVDLFPTMSSASPLADFGANTLEIGNPGVGNASAQGGAVVKAAGMNLGEAGTGNGTVTATGAGTQVLLGGTDINQLQVGNWGTGSLTVAAGALVDATVNAAACIAHCYSFVGNGAGSTGTLTITGAGSEVRTQRYFFIGDTTVSTVAQGGFNFGTPGGATQATVNVLNGATLRSQGVIAGNVATSAAALGTETATATITISGAGSQWLASRSSVIDNDNAFFAVGRNAGGTANVTVSNGGLLRVDGTGSPATGFDSMQIGLNGAHGSVTVTGTGSSLVVTGHNPLINVGVTANGQGTLSVVAGATASSMFLNVGRDTGTGTLLIDGAGSQVNLVGVATPGVQGAAGANVGQTGGSGQATVQNGGHWLISDGGADSRTPYSSQFNGSPYLNVGRDAGSTGSVTITGAGSILQMTSTSLSPPAGTGDNYNPFMSVGRYPGGTGTVTINNGGTLLLQGNALSTVADSRSTSLNIGGSSDTDPGGTGSATVSGAGSSIQVIGSDGFIGVGRGSGAVGSLTIQNGGSVTTLNMGIGRSGGNGTLALDNGQLTLSGQQTGNLASGASLSIGQGGGTGTFSAVNGSTITITNPGSAGASMNVGGSGNFPLGTGTMTLGGGSTITINAAPGQGSFTIARDGTGTALISGSSSVSVAGGNAWVGRVAGANGVLNMGASSLTADSIGIGGDSDTTAGGIGSVSLSLASTLTATGANGFIGVGRNGIGSLDVADNSTVNAIVLNVGRASGGVGTLNVSHSALNLSGQRTSDGIGAALSIGNRGGSGTANLLFSTVTIANAGSDGVSLNVGGTPINPLGTGTLNATNSNITLTATPGKATARIGHDGTGTANLNSSLLDVGDGQVLVAGQPGSTGTLTLSNNSVINAGNVGVGATLDSAGHIVAGGTGHLILNDSTINTDTFEIGATSILSGNNGIINATGNVTVAGTISPGNSPGRIIIHCNLIMLPGSTLLFDVQDTGSGFNIDHLILGNDSTFDLSGAHIVFNFLGNTDPTAFAAAGGFDLDNFLESEDLNPGPNQGAITGLSTVFAAGTTWDDIIDPGQITAVSSLYDVTDFRVQSDGSVSASVTPAAAVPEPGSWALMTIGLAGMVALVRRRRATPAQARASAA